jgi:anti-sigma-K factor RskA
MSLHEQFAEDLALYALGTLEGEERAALESHLSGCNVCRRELEALRGDMALMALSAAGPAAPQRSRARLLNAIKQEPRALAVRRAGGSWWKPAGWIVAAALLGMVVLMAIQNDRQRHELGNAFRIIHEMGSELQNAQAVVSVLTSPDAQVIQVSEPNAPPRPQGKAFYVKDRSSLIFIASNMPALPEQKAYELWLIPANGSAPIPAGVFKPDKRGNATVVNPPLPSGIEAKAFAITIEPEEGSTTPTMPIKMIGS